jgi:hypothetical protein
MQPLYFRWRNLFLFCFGVAVATSFIMQWLSNDFWLEDQKFSILGLELFYSKKEVITVLTQIKPPARMALNYQLVFDFVFMAGVYPGIASLCMMVREKTKKQAFKNALFALAMFQPVAWAFDITENIFLFNWMEKPEIGDEFGTYHNIVAAKWLIALAGAITAITLLIFRKNTKRKPAKI